MSVKTSITHSNYQHMSNISLKTLTVHTQDGTSTEYCSVAAVRRLTQDRCSSAAVCSAPYVQAGQMCTYASAVHILNQHACLLMTITACDHH